MRQATNGGIETMMMGPERMRQGKRIDQDRRKASKRVRTTARKRQTRKVGR